MLKGSKPLVEADAALPERIKARSTDLIEKPMLMASQQVWEIMSNSGPYTRSSFNTALLPVQ